MREISFRAWNKRTGEMEHAIELTSYADDSLGVNRPNGGGSSEQFVVMQFTGLLDKNGKGIWEGDLVYVDYNTYTEKILAVVWESDRWGLGPNFDNGDYYRGDDIDWGRVEVVGNAYENPQLLETKSS